MRGSTDPTPRASPVGRCLVGHDSDTTGVGCRNSCPTQVHPGALCCQHLWVRVGSSPLRFRCPRGQSPSLPGAGRQRWAAAPGLMGEGWSVGPPRSTVAQPQQQRQQRLGPAEVTTCGNTNRCSTAGAASHRECPASSQLPTPWLAPWPPWHERSHCSLTPAPSATLLGGTGFCTPAYPCRGGILPGSASGGEQGRKPHAQARTHRGAKADLDGQESPQG